MKLLLFNRLSILILVVYGVALPPLNAQPYKDSSLFPEVRTADLLQRMTLEEKIAQIRHIHSWNIFDEQELNKDKLQEFVGDLCWGFVEGFPLTSKSCHQHMRCIQEYMLNHTRLGIPIFTVAEALHGSVHEGSTIYPQNIALASTFNPDLAYLRAAEITKELHYQGINQILAPCVDVVRDLRWGRVEESYGEDPFLNTLFACKEVQGYLDNGISPMLKHFGAHGNPLGGLNLASVHCGVGELHDVYLKPFQKVVSSFPIHAVMSAYNSWNRIPNSSSYYLLTEVLRNRWGFQGYVYSDWGAVDMLHTFQRTASSQAEAAVQAISAGLDVEASSECFPYLTDMIKEQKVDLKLIDKAVSRVLLAKFRMGLFEDPYGDRYDIKALHTPDNVRLARQIADESVVLLKNDNGLLPLDLTQLNSIAVIGPNADQVQFGDYSWSRANKDGVTPLDGIRRLTESYGIQIHYAKGCDMMSLDTTFIATAVKAVRQSDVAILFCGSASASLARDYNKANCGEGFDLANLSLTGAQEELIRAVHATGKPVVLVLVTGKPFSIAWEKEHLPAILVQWYAGEQEGNAIADILFGRVNPSGHLTVSFPQSSGHLPVYYNHLPTDKGFYHKPGSYEQSGRDYVFSSTAPLWSFGHGLSYTNFDYTDLQIQHVEDSVKVFVTLKNIGARTGKAVPQLYVRDVFSSVSTPVKQLKAFQKVELKPNEVARVPLHFAIEDLAFTDERGETVVESGDFAVYVGDASDNILLKDTITIGATHIDYCPINEDKSPKEIGKGMKIRIAGMVRDVQATLADNVEIYSVAQQRVVGVTDKKGRFIIEAAEDDVLVFKKSGYLDEKISVDGNKNIQIIIRSGVTLP